MCLGVQVDHVDKRYGEQPVLRDVCWKVPAGAVVGLLGASGAGKTTLLRLVAGLERPDSGSVSLTDADRVFPRVNGAANMVFQNLALWPHLTARRHVELVLKRSLPAAARRGQAEVALSEARLPTTTWKLRPGQLSGGEAQRLALARALAPSPRLLLLDEPFGQLDAPLRLELLAMLREIVERRGVTVIFVSHRWSEVVELCPTVAALDDGRLVQQGGVDDLFWRPASAAVARLAGPVVKLKEKWLQQRRIAGDAGHALLPPDGEKTLLARPQQLRLCEAHDANCWRVVQRAPHGAAWSITLDSVDGEERLRLTAPQPPMAKETGVELLPPGL